MSARLATEDKAYHADSEAYLGTPIGLVPCTVLEVRRRCHGGQHDCGAPLKVRVDQDLKGYHKNEIINCGPDRVIPKDHVIFMGNELYIETCYYYEPTPTRKEDSGRTNNNPSGTNSGQTCA